METNKIPQEEPMTQTHLENGPVHKSFFNQNGNIFLILGAVIIILVVLVIGGYLLTMNKSSNPNRYTPQSTPTSSQPTSLNETANWKIYTNSTYGFQLKSPNGMSESSRGKGVLEVEGGLQIIYSVINLSSDRENIKKNWTNVPGFPEPEALKTLVDAYLNANTNSEILLSYEKLSAFLLCKESDSCPRVENQHTSTISGYQALQYSYDFKSRDNQTITQTNISILADGKIYRFWTGNQEGPFMKIVNTLTITQ